MSNFPENVHVYLVGGAVRDKLLGLPVTDHDYVVVGASPELMLSLGFKPVGQDFPVFLHPKTGEEYALARTERKTGQGYQGFTVSFGEDVTLVEDLARRDLTVNALAQDEDGVIYDPYQGQVDIEKKVLRHVSSAFSEDPLRVLRLARFHAKLAPLGFTIAPQTWQLAKKMVENKELAYLTVERIWIEVSKALRTDAPQVFFQDLYELGALDVLGMANKLANATFAAMNDGLISVMQHTNAPEIRFAAWLEPYFLAGGEIKDKLPLPKHYRYWLNLFVNHARVLRHWNAASAEAKWQVFKHSGSLRHEGDVVKFAQALGLSAQLLQAISDSQFQLHSISPQSLLEKGVHGQALGEAIKAKQIAMLTSKANKT